MKVEQKDGSTERKVIIALITDATVLGRIALKWNKGLFRSRWANLIGGWCIDYFTRYEKAPGNHIESMFEAWSTDAKDKESLSMVERFLSSLSEEYEESGKEANSDYLIDLASTYFNQVKIEKLRDSLDGDLSSGDLEKSLTRIQNFNKIEMGVGEGIDVLLDQEAVKEAFKDKQESLIVYPGDLGKHFFQDQLARDGFIAFAGPEKRGKSQWLMDMAWRAMLQRKRVALFEVGDMSQNQIMRRMMVRVAHHPRKAGTIKVPVSIRKEDDFSSTVEFREETFDTPLNYKLAWKACEEVLRGKIKSKKSYLKLSCHPNSSINVKGIESILQTWERMDWIPDVVVIDYADILAPLDGKADTREQINQTWKALRGLSQKRHCLVVTATQTDAASYKMDTITKSNFSEDKRKHAHVTGMIGLNQTKEEKLNGVMRLNWLDLREAEYSEYRCIHVAGCPALSNPAIRSVW